MPFLQMKTIEQARRKKDYVNKAFARFLRLTILESIVVLFTLERPQNGRVHVLTGPLTALVEAVVGDGYTLLRDLEQVNAKDAIVDMNRASICNPRRFLLHTFHLCDKTTAFVRVFDLPRVPHVSVLLAHRWS